MNDITVITPPDFLHNDALNLLVICPSAVVKDSVHNILLNTDVALNLLVYETPIDNIHNLEWLLTSVKIANIVIIDVDNCDPLTHRFATHIIAQPKTFYLTKDNVTPYNLISKGRVYDFAWLEALLNRGNNEETI